MDLQAEYDNFAKVPDGRAIVAGWARDAAAFRAAHPHAELNIPYGPGPRQMLDIFWPGPTRPSPARPSPARPSPTQQEPLMLYIHGGYWQAMDKTSSSHLARGLLAHGVAVAIPSYDLCPDVTLAALTDQLRDAAAFLARGYTSHMLASGHSAGGHLAAMLMATPATDWAARGLSAPPVRHALALSGLFDLPPLVGTSVNTKLGLDAAEARRLSPLFLPPPGGRIHAVVGSQEGAEYTRQSRSIAEAWGGTWESLPDAHHFNVMDQLTDPNSAMVRHAQDLLA